MISKSSLIYLDNHATTQVDPRVLQAMLPYFTQSYANAGSVSHAPGHAAKDAVEAARARIAAALGAEPREIVFTSGATESNNLAIKGIFERHQRRATGLISVVTEHRAVLDPLNLLARRGAQVTLLPVVPEGHANAGWLDPDVFEKALVPGTLLASVMLANNEIGIVQPIAELASRCKKHGVLLHCDATQAVGKIPVNVRELGVDLLSFSAHKLYGPKGVGGLFVRREGVPVRLSPQMDGGGQEGGLRSGTLNVPGIMGLAEAVCLATSEMPAEAARLTQLRHRLYERTKGQITGVLLNGPDFTAGQPRLPGNLNLSFTGVDGEALMLAIPQLAVSSGSACTSSNPEPSHVLRALGLSDDLARGSLRFGIGRFNTPEEIDQASDWVSQAVQKLRQLGET